MIAVESSDNLRAELERQYIRCRSCAAPYQLVLIDFLYRTVPRIFISWDIPSGRSTTVIEFIIDNVRIRSIEARIEFFINGYYFAHPTEFQDAFIRRICSSSYNWGQISAHIQSIKEPI